MVITMPARLVDAFKAHPVDINEGHLDLRSVHELPESYAWAAHDEHPQPVKPCSLGRESVPTIDLSGPNVLEQVGCACQTWGVFQVINHGIPATLLADIEAASLSLFALPMEQKLRAARSPNGVTGYGLARISSFFTKLMWSEGFTILGSPLEHAKQLWPHDYTAFCDVIDAYEKEMNELARKLMWLILGSLNIDKEDVKWAGPKGDFKDAKAALQMNSYPACPDPDRAMGLAPHTDSTLLTILYQNLVSGLQVFKEGSGWVTVPPLPGALIVNIGDLLHIISNGTYPSIRHRVVVNRTHQRLSVAYLYGPADYAQISPLSKLVGSGRSPLYRAVSWSEYLGIKAKHFNEGLSCVRL